MSHPSELYETLGGAAALATGGLALGADAGGAGLLGGLGDIFGGGSDITAAAGGDSAALDAVAAGATPSLAPAVDAASTSPFALGDVGLDPSIAASYGGDAGASAGAAPGAFDIGAAQEGSGAIQGIAANPAYGGPGGGSSFLSSLGQGAINSVTKNPLGIAAAGAGLGLDILKGNPNDPNKTALQNEVGQLATQGSQLGSYLSKGTLPPALQAQLNQAVQAEKARIVSGYAAKGMPTDPSQNSALAQDLNNVDTNALAAKANTEIQLLNTGLKETGMSTEMYQILIQLDEQQNTQLMQAIASFAGALGGGGGQTIKLPAGSTVT